MLYDELTQSIQISEQVAGNYTIVFRLTDAQGAVTSSEVTFEILEPEIEDESAGAEFDFAFDTFDLFEPDLFEQYEPDWDTFDNNDLETVVKEICKAQVYEMTTLGELKVKFTTPMATEFIDLKWLNSTIIDMYIIPADDR